MKGREKRFHARLVAGIGAAGAMTITTDAYAQTNTERLMTVVDNTESANSMLDMIMAAINDGVASILAAIGALDATVDAGLHAIDDDLMAVDADLQSIHGDLMNVDADLILVHDDLTTVHEDLETVHADLENVDADLMLVHEDLETVHADLANVDADLVLVHNDLETVHADLEMMDADIQHLDEDIRTLTDSVNSLGTIASQLAPIADQSAETQAGVEANSAAINELKTMLMGISDNLGVVQNQTAPVEVDEEAMAAAVGSELHSDADTITVEVSAFKLNKYDAKVNTYETALTFSCEAPVFMEAVKINGVAAIGDPATRVGTNVVTPFTDDANRDTSIMVGTQTLYDTDFVGAAATSVFYNDVTLNLAPLSTDGLVIKISHMDASGGNNNGTDIGGDSPTAGEDDFTIKEYLLALKEGKDINDGETNAIETSDAGDVELFQLDISWYSSADDAKCTLKTPTSTDVEYAERDETVSAALTVKAGEEDALKAVNDLSFSCNGATAVRSLTFDNLQSGFADFIDLQIDDGGTPQDLTLTDEGSNVYTSTLDDPLEFDSGTFTLSGEIIGAGPVLVTVTYDTVTNAECTLSTG